MVLVECECGPDYRMPREGNLSLRREDPQAHGVLWILWSEDKHRLGEIQLPREALHVRRVDLIGIAKHRELVARVGVFGEHIHEEESMGHVRVCHYLG